jgi:NADH pyrophosphatase NudC (nudix superfamily)
MELKQIFSTYSKEENVDLGQFKYCPFCGTCLVFKEKGGKQRPDCPDCEFVQFRNPAPGVVVVKGGFWEREMGSSPGVCG